MRHDRSIAFTAFTNIAAVFLITFISVGLVSQTDLAGQTLAYVTQQYLSAELLVVVGTGACGYHDCHRLFGRVHPSAEGCHYGRYLPRWVGRENRNGEPVYVLLVLYAASVATVFLNIPLQVLASGVTLAVVAMFILVTMVDVRLPSQLPEVFERDAVRVNRYLSPRIVRNASAVALAIIEKATAMGIKEADCYD